MEKQNVKTTGSKSPAGVGRFRAAGVFLGFVTAGMALTLAARAQEVAAPASRPAATQPSRFAPPGTPVKETKPIPAYWKTTLADIDQALAEVRKGKVDVLGRSAGGRKLYVVRYGQAPDIDSQAFYNSACGGGEPAAYARKPAGTPPVVLLLGPVHGQEIEGIAGVMNLIHLAETGADLRGKTYPRLLENFQKCRVLIVPSGNPDGRARTPLESFIGEDMQTQTYYGMGTFTNGRLRQWPQVKREQPMAGDVGFLGAYFNDAGINPMHDDWFGRMQGESDAILDLARREAVDYGLSLHTHGSGPQVLQTDYMDEKCQEKAVVISERVSARFPQMNERTNPIRRRNPAPPSSQPSRRRRYTPDAFNLCSALHHVCGGTILLYENSCGVKGYHQTTPDTLLDLQMVVFEELLAYAVENPVVWER